MLQTEVLWKAPVVTTATRFKFEIKIKSSKVTSHKTFYILYHHTRLHIVIEYPHSYFTYLMFPCEKLPMLREFARISFMKKNKNKQKNPVVPLLKDMKKLYKCRKFPKILLYNRKLAFYSPNLFDSANQLG